MQPPASPLRFDVITLFPGIFDGFLGESMVKRAIAAGLIQVERHDLRPFGQGRHLQLDDRPFGGGPGMLMMAPPVVDAVRSVQSLGATPGRLLAMTPQGRRLDQAWVRELAEEPRLVLLCGRYEGFDERIFEILEPEELSIGDYVLSGGEVPAMVVIDAVMRLVPGVLGDEQSALEDSFGPDETLDHPQYTRPREFRGLTVPEVLLSGDHAAIARWRRAQAERKTRARRPPAGPPENIPLPHADTPTHSRGQSHAERIDGAG